jgi:hypothetical protein
VCARDARVRVCACACTLVQPNADQMPPHRPPSVPAAVTPLLSPAPYAQDHVPGLRRSDEQLDGGAAALPAGAREAPRSVRVPRTRGARWSTHPHRPMHAHCALASGRPRSDWDTRPCRTCPCDETSAAQQCVTAAELAGHAAADGLLGAGGVRAHHLLLRAGGVLRGHHRAGPSPPRSRAPPRCLLPAARRARLSPRSGRSLLAPPSAGGTTSCGRACGRACGC